MVSKKEFLVSAYMVFAPWGFWEDEFSLHVFFLLTLIIGDVCTPCLAVFM